MHHGVVGGQTIPTAKTLMTKLFKKFTFFVKCLKPTVQLEDNIVEKCHLHILKVSTIESL